MSALRAVAVGLLMASLVMAGTPESGRQYQPEAGDIIIFQGWRLCQRPLRTLAQRPVQRLATGGSNYLHVGLIVVDDRHRLKLLEADRTEGVQLRSPLAYMDNWQSGYGQVWVRCRQQPLTDQESEALTEFALNHQGEPYARLGEVANYLFAAPLVEELPSLTEPFDQGAESQRWFCSKLVVEALRSADLISPFASGAGSAPKHLVNETFGLYPDWDLPYRWTSDRQAR